MTYMYYHINVYVFVPTIQLNLTAVTCSFYQKHISRTGPTCKWVVHLHTVHTWKVALVIITCNVASFDQCSILVYSEACRCTWHKLVSFSPSLYAQPKARQWNKEYCTVSGTGGKVGGNFVHGCVSTNKWGGLQGVVYCVCYKEATSCTYM